jgi:hypothetical protein
VASARAPVWAGGLAGNLPRGCPACVSGLRLGGGRLGVQSAAVVPVEHGPAKGGSSPKPVVQYRYHPEILAELLKHGVRPTPTTAPRLVADFLSDLYRYEIRRLRNRLRRGEVPKERYADEVVALRRRYPLVSVPVRLWTISEQG